MTVASAAQCWQPRPAVKRVKGGEGGATYQAVCKCGWRFQTTAAPSETRAARITAEAEAMAHYFGGVQPDWLAAYRALLPACLSVGQQDLLIELLSGKAIQNPAYSLRGSAVRHRSRYTNNFQSFIDRLRERGAVIDVTTGPRGGMGSASYTLAGAQL